MDVSKNKLLTHTPFRISSFTWKNKKVSINPSLILFCFVLKTIYFMRIKLTLHVKGFSFYKSVSYVYSFKSLFPQHLKTQPSENPSYEISFPCCTDALYYLFILHHFAKEHILPLDCMNVAPISIMKVACVHPRVISFLKSEIYLQISCSNNPGWGFNYMNQFY